MERKLIEFGLLNETPLAQIKDYKMLPKNHGYSDAR